MENPTKTPIFAAENHCFMCSHNEVIEGIRSVAEKNLPKTGRIYLYGSRARGDAHEDSDWDLLIILDKPQIEQSDYDNVSYPLTSLGWDLGEMIIPVMYTKEEWDKSSFTPFYKNVVQDGILIA